MSDSPARHHLRHTPIDIGDLEKQPSGGTGIEPAVVVDEQPTENPDSVYPRLPDGSIFDDYPDDYELTETARRVLNSLQQGLEFRGEHSEFLRQILTQRCTQVLLRRQIRVEMRKPESNRDLGAIAKASDQIRKIDETLVKLFKELDLLRLSERKGTPYDYVQRIRARAVEFMQQRGYQRAYACPDCGHISMVYALYDLDVRDLRWDEIEKELLGRGLVPAQVTPVLDQLKRMRLLVRGNIVVTPHSHPWLNHPHFPIFSPELRDMLHQRCECGRARLTLEEAGKILRISPVAVDQLEQEDRRLRGLPPLEGEDLGAKSIFEREGEETAK